jgi:hypothetical protein
LPSGPNAIRPPLWMPPRAMPVTIGCTRPPSLKRTIRLSLSLVK